MLLHVHSLSVTATEDKASRVRCGNLVPTICTSSLFCIANVTPATVPLQLELEMWAETKKSFNIKTEKPLFRFLSTNHTHFKFIRVAVQASD
jgi:hypothetical protein